MLTYLAVWYIFTITTYGVWVPAGLFLPGIIVGCAIGAIYEEINQKVFSAQCQNRFWYLDLVLFQATKTNNHILILHSDMEHDHDRDALFGRFFFTASRCHHGLAYVDTKTLVRRSLIRMKQHSHYILSEASMH